MIPVSAISIDVSEQWLKFWRRSGQIHPLFVELQRRSLLSEEELAEVQEQDEARKVMKNSIWHECVIKRNEIGEERARNIVEQK